MTTVDDVVRELRKTPTVWRLAYNLPIRASIQSVSNALRHAYRAGLVERRPFDHNRYEWRIAGGNRE